MADFTTEQLAAVRKAIALGETRVTYPDGSSIQYRTVDELLKAEARIRAAVEPSVTTMASGGCNPRVSVAHF
jgi:hypothetical protein